MRDSHNDSAIYPYTHIHPSMHLIAKLLKLHTWQPTFYFPRAPTEALVNSNSKPTDYLTYEDDTHSKSQAHLVNPAWSALVVLDTAHEAAAYALVMHEDDFSRYLRAEKHALFESLILFRY